MALTYEWAITSLKKTAEGSIENVVAQTYWTCTGTDADGYSGTFNGATPFDPNLVDADNFTLYENLTETQVLGWIQSIVNINTYYKNHIDIQIEKQISAIVKPKVDVNHDELPWSIAPPTPLPPEPTGTANEF